MKRIILVIAFLMLATEIYAQDRIDPPSYLWADTMFNFNQNRFVKGWNWAGDGKKLDSALKMNFGQGAFMPSAERPYPYWVMHGQNWIMGLGKTASGDAFPAITQAQAMHYEPYLQLDTTDNFHPFPGDSTGAVFGFKYRNPAFIDNQDMFHNFVMRKDILRSLGKDTVLVLSQPWPDDELRDMTFGSSNDNAFNGYELYLTLRLRSLENITHSNASDTVMIIRMPYRTLAWRMENQKWSSKTGTGYINFDSIPGRDIKSGAIEYMWDSRTPANCLGLSRKMIVPENNPSYLYITADMLSSVYPPDTNKKYITISAKFYCDNKLDQNNNPKLHNAEIKGVAKNVDDPSPRITNLGIEITYCGKLDIALDWIRIETPQYRNLARGLFDRVIIDQLKASIDTLRFYRPDIKIYRFYGIDEFWTNNWQSQRYLNKLLDDNLVSELDHIAIQGGRFTHATGFKQYWKGRTRIIDYDFRTPAPYIRRSDYWDGKKMIFLSPEQRLGLSYGYWGLPDWRKDEDSCMKHDTLNSHYESCIARSPGVTNGHLLDSVKNEDIHELYWGKGDTSYAYHSALMHTENILYSEYYKTSSSIFGKPLWANIWQQSWWTVDSSGNILNHHRSRTAEELRLNIGLNIVLGAKGLLYYSSGGGILEYNKNNKSSNGEIGLSSLHWYNQDSTVQTNLPSGWDLIDCEELGGDFLGNPDRIDVNRNGKIYSLSNFVNTDVTRFDVLNLKPERIYLSRRSQRSEIAKTNTWIERVEDQLVNLRLTAWYAKGFKKWYVQDSSLFGGNNVLRKVFRTLKDPASSVIFDTSYFRVRPINRKSCADNRCIENEKLPYYEPWEDSTFFDITLLRHFNDSLLDGSQPFYIGLQNRRTSPLIRFYDTISISPLIIDSTMKFLSASEFEDSCAISYATARWSSNPEKWRKLWWTRGGAREYTIPFNFKLDTNDDRKYALLHISELGANDSVLNKFPWRNNRYYHTIDTVIGQDKELVLKLLPGEYKILKVEVLPPGSPMHGELGFSNQRKLVGHPIRDDSNELVSDSLYYHLVYHKTLTDGTSKVFYRRSKPVDPETANGSTNIIWEMERCISDSIICYDGQSRIANPDCKYPALVVRYDSITARNKIYIVYTCQNTLTCIDHPECIDNYVTIVENSFDADEINQSIPPGRALRHASGYGYEKWGHVMINASQNGNYYVWNDSIQSIQAAWKPSNADRFSSSFDFAASSFRFHDKTGHYASHPSLNSYSRIQDNEPDCAVVWEESTTLENSAQKNIYYSLLSVAGDGTFISHHLVPQICTNNPTYAFNTDTTIIRMSYTDESCHYPTVLRSAGESIANGSGKTYDIIVYEAGRSDISITCSTPLMDSLNYINSHTVHYSNLYGEPSGIGHTIFPRSRVISHANSLSSPNMAQGCCKNTHKDVVLEFAEYNRCSQNNTDYRILSYPHDYYSIARYPWNITRNDYLDPHFEPAKILHSNSRLPQLAALPYTGNQQDWTMNRRVFESDSSISEIYTSAKEFYKRDESGYVFVPFLGYSDSLKNSSISYIRLDGNYILLNILDTGKVNCDTCMPDPLMSMKDTISSAWFSVGNSSDLSFLCYGLDNNDLTLMIQKRNTRDIAALRSQSVHETRMENINYHLINGRNDEFRILFTKKRTNMTLQENVVLISDADLLQIIEKTNGTPSIIDLENMSEVIPGETLTINIYPNPADNTINAIAYLPQSDTAGNSKISSVIVLTVYSNIGSEIYKLEIKPGAIISIPTDQLSQGAYFIRAEEKPGTSDNPLPAVVRSFVIAR